MSQIFGLKSLLPLWERGEGMREKRFVSQLVFKQWSSHQLNMLGSTGWGGGDHLEGGQAGIATATQMGP